MEPPPPSLLPHVDELLMEYLLFRGFTKVSVCICARSLHACALSLSISLDVDVHVTQSFQVFSAERKRDRAKGFDVEQIIAQLLSYVQKYGRDLILCLRIAYQVESIMETWKFLTARFFNHLDASYAATIHKLELSLLRFLLMLLKYANKLNATLPANDAEIGDSWCRWFILPYIQSPESDAYFQLMQTGFLQQRVAGGVPDVVSELLDADLPESAAPKAAGVPTHAPRGAIAQDATQTTAKIKKLEDAGRHLHSLLRRMVQHNYREEFARTNGHHSGDAFTNGGGFSVQEMRELSELFGIRTNDGEQKLQKQPSNIQEGDEQQPAKRSGRDTERKETLEQRVDAAVRKSAIKREDTGDGQSVNAAQSELSLVGRFHTQQHNQKTPTNASPGLLCRMSRDGSRVAISALGSKLITIWSATPTGTDEDDGETRTPLSTIRLLAPLTSISWTAASIQDQLLFGVADGTLNLWSMREQRVISRITSENGAIQSLTIADNAVIALCGGGGKGDGAVSGSRTRASPQDQQLMLITLASSSSRERMRRSTTWRCSERIECVAFESNGSVFVTGSATGAIRVYDSTLRHPLSTWHVSGRHPPPPISPNTSSTERVLALTLSPDGTTLVTLHSATGDTTMMTTKSEGSKGRSASCYLLEWAFSEDAFARAAADLTSNDDSSSDDSMTGTALDTNPAAPPRLMYSYPLQFHSSSRSFVVIASTGNAPRSVYLYQRGETTRPPRELVLPFGSSQLTDFDWIGASSSSSSPQCCGSSVAKDGQVGLWDFDGVL
ncbi:hypothetical protein FI667_g6704, partial [Globisporangium splendens]